VEPPELFDLPLLQAISDWQRGGDPKQNLRRGQTLKAACAGLPYEYKTTLLQCFRQIALPKKGAWDLIGVDHLDEKISSWTLDLEVAKGFKNGVPPAGQGYHGVIFSIFPSSDRSIVNLDKLFRLDAFQSAIGRWQSQIIGFGEGMKRYMGTQSEVVLEVSSISQDDIYSLGGHSSDFDALVRIAELEIFGRTASADERETLLLKAEPLRTKAGPKWLSIDASKRVLLKMKPEAEMLREIKRVQKKHD
jgi:hypothetical protein